MTGPDPEWQPVPESRLSTVEERETVRFTVYVESLDAIPPARAKAHITLGGPLRSLDTTQGRVVGVARSSGPFETRVQVMVDDPNEPYDDDDLGLLPIDIRADLRATIPRSSLDPWSVGRCSVVTRLWSRREFVDQAVLDDVATGVALSGWRVDATTLPALLDVPTQREVDGLPFDLADGRLSLSEHPRSGDEWLRLLRRHVDARDPFANLFSPRLRWQPSPSWPRADDRVAEVRRGDAGVDAALALQSMLDAAADPDAAEYLAPKAAAMAAAALRLNDDDLQAHLARALALSASDVEIWVTRAACMTLVAKLLTLEAILTRSHPDRHWLVECIVAESWSELAHATFDQVVLSVGLLARVDELAPNVAALPRPERPLGDIGQTARQGRASATRRRGRPRG